MAAYAEMLGGATSTEFAPWYVIPGDLQVVPASWRSERSSSE